MQNPPPGISDEYQVIPLLAPLSLPGRRLLLPALAGVLLLHACSADRSVPGPSGPPGPPDQAAPLVDPRDEAASVFHPDSLYHFEVTMEDSLLDWLDRHALDEEYVPADVKVQGQVYREVGIRYKGAYGTLKLCFDGAGNLVCDKLSIKIRFDEYAGRQRFHGLKRLNLHSLVRDPTKLRDRLASRLFRDAGIPASRAVHATLSINGRSLGLFGLVEQIDGRYTESRFPASGDGNLYKEVWPQSIEPGPYLDALETNSGDGDPAPMIRFARGLRTLSAETQDSVLRASIDVDYTLRYLAVDQIINNWDGATTFYCSGLSCSPHNFYWYQDDRTGKLWLIPWDFDGTFASTSFWTGLPEWNDTTAACDPIPFSGDASIRPASCDPLWGALARHHQAGYRKAVVAVLDDVMDLSRLQGLIDGWAAQIEPHLENDPTRSQSMAQWRSEVLRLKETLPLLRRNAQRRLDRIPSTPFGLALDSDNGFEGWMPIEVEGAITTYFNRNTEAAHSLNEASPLSGARDYRLDFTFRDVGQDAADAWKHYIVSSMPLAPGPSADMRGIRAIRFTARADTSRFVRLDLVSGRYSDSYSGVFYGWEAQLGPQAKTFTLDFGALALPSWGAPIPETLEHILEAVNGLQWSPTVLGRDSRTGLLGEGKEDSGYIQIDDIQFLIADQAPPPAGVTSR